MRIKILPSSVCFNSFGGRFRFADLPASTRKAIRYWYRTAGYHPSWSVVTL